MSFDNVLANVKVVKLISPLQGFRMTDERKKVYDFSDSYYTSEM
ncbi:MAG: hypothetical protein ACLUSV_02310 [Streptococcus sp.]